MLGDKHYGVRSYYGVNQSFVPAEFVLLELPDQYVDDLINFLEDEEEYEDILTAMVVASFSSTEARSILEKSFVALIREYGSLEESMFRAFSGWGNHQVWRISQNGTKGPDLDGWCRFGTPEEDWFEGPADDRRTDLIVGYYHFATDYFTRSVDLMKQHVRYHLVSSKQYIDVDGIPVRDLRDEL
jgi:hypothetical protein